jgi:hypothetical protein
MDLCLDAYCRLHECNVGECAYGLDNRLTLVGPILVTEIGVINPKQSFTGLLIERLSVQWLRIRLRLAHELVGRF